MKVFEQKSAYVVDAQGHTRSLRKVIKGYHSNYNGKRRLKKQVKILRIGSWNVGGTMIGRGREIVDVMERRNIEILCVRDTKWKGNTARQLGNVYKLLYSGYDTKTNGAEIVLSMKVMDKMAEVDGYSERIMGVKLTLGKELWNVISVYAPQIGREDMGGGKSFVEELEDMIRKIPGNETIIGGDFNAHLGEWNRDYREQHGQHGYGNSNGEGEQWLEMMEMNKLFALNTCFKKRR